MFKIVNVKAYFINIVCNQSNKFTKIKFRDLLLFSILAIVFGYLFSQFLFFNFKIDANLNFPTNFNYYKILASLLALFIFQFYLFIIYNKLRKKKYRTLFGFMFGLGYFFFGLLWINDSMYINAGLALGLSLSACLLFAMYNALFIACAFFLAPNIFLLPFTWVLLEWLRGTLLTGFPWLSIGYGFLDTPFAGFANYIGVYGISLAALVCINLLYYSCFKHSKRKLSILFLILVIILTCLVNIYKPSLKQKSKLNIRVIQAGIKQNMKFDIKFIEQGINQHLDLMLQKQKVDLIITPETAFPVIIHQLPKQILAELNNYAALNNTSILFGAAGVINKNYTNSLFFLRPNISTLQIYDKYHLVPFGEFVPIGFKWFVNNLIMPMGDFARGNLVQSNFEIKNKAKFSANICYELIFGEEMAAVNRVNQPDFFVNSTNMGWFGKEGIYQFLNMGRMRALELQKTIIISNNSGVSAIILPDGSINKYIDVDNSGYFDDNITIYKHFNTFYSNFANLPLLSFIAIILFVGYYQKKKNKK